MKPQSVKESFIELRAKGFSFDRIGKELKTNKQTLIDWSKELQDEIANRKALELETLYESFYLLKEYRLKNFGSLLNKIEQELQARDLSDVPTDKLLDLFLKYNSQLKEEIVEPVFKSSQEIAEELQDRELLERLVSTSPSVKLKVG
jgi:hypothetical protein